MIHQYFNKISVNVIRRQGSGLLSTATLALVLFLTLTALPALAHHPFGGQIPSTIWQGFLSGLGHPVIGLDHLSFVIAMGLLAGLLRYGFTLPIAFVLTSLIGTGLHLGGFDLPAPEFIVSASVLVFGGFLALTQKPPIVVILSLGAIAGAFHGYAYGEAIIGAEMQPIVAYLLGFATIQTAIALAGYGLAKKGTSPEGQLNLRFAGFLIAGLGLAFLSKLLLS